MAYDAGEARQELLDTIGDAADDIGVALAALGAAHEQLDERSADELEEQLFRPGQATYARARRTYTGFAERHRLRGRSFEAAQAGLPSTGARGFVDQALEALERADAVLAELQDSMRPVDVGDAELRAGLAEVRDALGQLPERIRSFTRTLGR